MNGMVLSVIDSIPPFILKISQHKAASEVLVMDKWQLESLNMLFAV
ncbi:MAG: hypothetical protein ACNYPE_08530 [Candidatus Azotimanducaceae bacterium WSBS_2022_MAG_OTU7]